MDFDDIWQKYLKVSKIVFANLQFINSVG